MPRGRRPATRGVYAIEDPALILPEVLALDTSFVVEALIETQPLHAVCAGFVERIVEAAPTVVTSELLEVELAEAAFAIVCHAHSGSGWPDRRRVSDADDRLRPRLLRRCARGERDRGRCGGNRHD